MTKKHFIALADMIKRDNVEWSQSHLNALADFCESENPQFNRERWMDYIAGNCGKNGGKVKQCAS